jgi:flagella basal body P-ring formation protein FlgA
MNLLKHFFAVPLILGMAAPCQAAVEPPQLAQIQKLVEQLVLNQTTGLPGKVSFTLGSIDTQLNLPACRSPQAFIPSGTRLWGSTSVGVRCTGTNPWTIYVPVAIKVMVAAVVAARPLTQGRVIEIGDLAVQESDLGLLPATAITETEQAIGRIVTVSIAGGQPLRQDLLRSPPVIQQGQSVTLRAQGEGFRVSAAGKAVTNASEGQVAQVRTPSGVTVNGIARLGAIVEVGQ